MNGLIEFLKEEREKIITESIGKNNVDFRPLVLLAGDFANASFENALEYMRKTTKPRNIIIPTRNNE